MNIKGIDKAAYKGEMPEKLTFPELYLYYSLAGMYCRFTHGDIDEEQGIKEKNQIMQSYNQCVQQWATNQTILKLLRHHSNPAVKAAVREMEEKLE